MFTPEANLQIGWRFGPGGEEASKIKRLHEVCVKIRTPHVHVVTGAGEYCLPLTYDFYLGR